ncbi:MAG TPA: UvrD-helicase domain-containing protein [Sphingobium sp.]
MKHTSEQQAILDRAPTKSIKVAAGAGCGKTSTLVAYGQKWAGRGLYLAFNKAIADEARRKFPANIETRTAHSFAFRALDIGQRGNLIPKFRFEHLRDYDDMIVAVQGMTDGQVRASILRTLENFLIDAGSKIKVEHCVLENTGQRNAVRKMVQGIAGKLLRFKKHDLPITHDTYLKAFELWHRIDDGFDYLLLDEAQDLNPVLISIANKSGLPTIVVGDAYQSIYRFRGAVNSMAQFKVEEFPLTQSWRFGAEVARLANTILSHHSTPPRRMLRGHPTQETEVLRYTGRVPRGPGTAILARTNARLFESLAGLDRPFHLLGGIADLQRQLSSAYALRQRKLHQVMDDSVARFTSWHAFDDAANKGDGEARRLRDIVDKHGSELPGLLEKLGRLHQAREADAQIIVSTAHKAKGREFDTVVVLDDFELPSTQVKRRQAAPAIAGETDQMINLLYVASTRATGRLLLADKLFDELA